MLEFAPPLKYSTVADLVGHPNGLWEALFSEPERLKNMDYSGYYRSQVPGAENFMEEEK
jgi:hypothetical protein